MIATLRDTLGTHDEAHIDEVPKWAAPCDPEGYWHIPRSAADRGYGMVRLSFWCGVSRHFAKQDMMTDKEPTDRRCGTCEGRWLGFVRERGAIFSPRSPYQLPKKCPVITGGDKRCPICGARTAWRRNYCHYDETHHTAGEALALYEPCPRHGWKHATFRDGRLVCRDWYWENDNRQCNYEFRADRPVPGEGTHGAPP